MVRLRNIEKNETAISADYFPEDSEAQGHISVDLKSGKVIESKESAAEDSLGGYIYHAVKRLREYAKMSDPPKEAIVMWY